MAKQMNVGIVGAGQVAALHAQALDQMRGVCVYAVSDPIVERAQTLATAHGAAVRSFDDVLADPAVTAVILATPSDLHLGQVRRCVLAGKHVLSEFPLFGKPAALAKVFDTAEQRGVCVRVAHTTHYLPPYVQARRILERGKIGTVHTVLYRRRLYRPGGHAPGRNWRDNALTHLGGHALDLLPWLLGDVPQLVHALAHPSAQEASVAGLLMHTASGAIGYISIDFESRPNSIWLEVAGSAGTLSVHGFSRLEIDGRVMWQSANDDVAYHAAIGAQDRDFIKTVQGRAPAISPRETLQLNEWMARALRTTHQQ